MSSEVISVVIFRFVLALVGLNEKSKRQRLDFILAALGLTLCGLAPRAEGQSPAAIAGTTFGIAVADGTYPLASSGYYFLIAADTSNQLKMANVLGATNCDCLYTYASNGPIAQIDFSNVALGQLTDELTFSDNYFGSYVLNKTDTGGQQQGNFIWFNGQAPTSLAGKSIYCNINDGTDPFAASGNATIQFATSGNAYTITLDSTVSVDSIGTYSYLRLNTASGKLVLNDSKAGLVTATFAFADQWNGSFGIRKNSTDSYQVGDFSILDEVTPRIEITSPKPGQSVSNEIVTVSGRAKDNVSVSLVLYSINGSDWLAADLSNNNLNWSANMVFTPGTNVFSVYAVDSSGNISPTNTARYVYVVNSQLSVTINGRGSLNPPYNNALLQIGASYTLTAIPATGYQFTSWTSSPGELIANRQALNFIMTTGLTFTANFVDIARPSLSIISPTPGQRWSNETLTVTGKARDNDRVAHVYYSLNNSDWIAVSTQNNWADWSIITGLVPGSNRLKTYAVDAAGNVSTTNLLEFRYILSAQLSVHAIGGRIIPQLNRAWLAVGQRYSLNVAASNGFAFKYWLDGHGAIITNKPALSFVMASNLNLTAYFSDIGKPSIIFSKNLSDLFSTNEFMSIRGHTTDNIRAKNVFFKLNEGGWQEATTTDGWENWTAALHLAPGTNAFFAYCVDSSGNVSSTNFAIITYLTVPASLNYLAGEGTSDSTSCFSLCFGARSFGGFSTDINYPCGVGTYSYTRLSTCTARLRVTYTSPPIAASTGPGDYLLYFTSPYSARFINNSTLDTGKLAFSFTPSLTMTSLVKQTFVYVNNQGLGKSTYFNAGKFSITDLASGLINNGTTLSYSLFGPANTLLRQTNSDGLIYTVTRYFGTNFGGAYVERYSPNGSLLGTDTGLFGFASQRPEGNAPADLDNRSVSISTSNSLSQLAFSADTFSQQSQDEGFESGVGDFVYGLADASTGNLLLTYTAPADISGSSSSADISFFAPNLGYLINGDSTVSMVAVSNLTGSLVSAPINKFISVTNAVYGYISQFQFLSNGSFSITGDTPGTGSYTYKAYSPETSLLRLTYESGYYAGNSGSLQLNFVSTNNGSYKRFIFDGSTNLLDAAHGNFGQQ